MIFLRKPPSAVVREFLAAQARLPPTYRGEPFDRQASDSRPAPRGFIVDHTRVRLGQGDRDFQSAKAALERWRQFDLGWCEAWPHDASLAVGSPIAVLARVLGVWWLNACRILSVVDEPEPVRRFGFTYGTLPGHVEMGEERFLLEWDPADDHVWYDILAVSRPRHVLARLGYPWTRRVQKRFARDSAAAMQLAVAAARG